MKSNLLALVLSTLCLGSSAFAAARTGNITKSAAIRDVKAAVTKQFGPQQKFKVSFTDGGSFIASGPMGQNGIRFLVSGQITLDKMSALKGAARVTRLEQAKMAKPPGQ